jgi:LacI family transcriptional regulator
MRTPQQVSQKLIAKEAGVSQATVSLVLSGRTVSSVTTRQRVLAAAERLRYRPNLLVQGIQTGKSRAIGVMAPPFDLHWSRILYGIHDVLSESDHVPISLWTRHHGPGGGLRTGYEISELQQIHRLLDRRVDGVILWPPFASLFSEHVTEFSSRDLPVVTVDHVLPAEFRADSVCSDEAMGARVIADHLLGLGHRRIGHLAGPSVATWAKQRRLQMEMYLQSVGSMPLICCEAPPGDTELGLAPARQLLSLSPRPTAVFAASDLYAKCVYLAAAELGLRIPQDLSVIGFSDDGFADVMQPGLTTVQQYPYDVGRRAAELVLGRSLGTQQDPVPLEVRMPVGLVLRGSTAKPAES